ncbi:hypothetical protein LX36DRAFT_684092 [Colletotrichum falcatum]|nr:hypothetical protein LX36DRAFT_684092 [Colletotrichum falcatum]
MANASQNRRSQPPAPVPSQMSSPYMPDAQDEWSPAAREPPTTAAGGYSRRRNERHARRQSSSSGGRAPGPADMPSSSSSIPHINGGGGGGSPHEGPGTPPRGSSLQHHQQQQQQQVPNPGLLRPPTPPGVGDDIDRIQSPSISKSVLEPLQRKMLEYHRLMDDAQGQMAQLDEELRALQDRRRLAEQRFVDAKAKHDEYERQHLDVERALRGDLPTYQPQQQQQQQQQQYGHSIMNGNHGNGNSPPRTAPRLASSIMSYDERPMSGHSSVPRKGKLRFSLFGR